MAAKGGIGGGDGLNVVAWWPDGGGLGLHLQGQAILGLPYF